MAEGRPLKFKTVEELQSKIDEYFQSCYEEVWEEKTFRDKKGKETSKEWVPVLDRSGKIKKVLVRPFTITGLALALDTSRETLLDYEDRPEFSDTIKRAKEIIHNYVEEQLMTRAAPTGVIFNLKNNWGWKDKTEVDANNTNLNANVESDLFNPEQRQKILEKYTSMSGQKDNNGQKHGVLSMENGQ